MRLLREKEGLLQKELADKLKLTQQTISLYESDKRDPDYKTLLKIANFFNISIDYLLKNEFAPLNNPITLKEVIDRAIRDKIERRQYHQIIKIAESLFPLDAPYMTFKNNTSIDKDIFIKKSGLKQLGFNTINDLDNVFETIFFEDNPDLRPEVVQKRYDLLQVEYLTGDKLSDWVQLIKKAKQFNILPQELMPVLEIIYLSRKEKDK